MKGIVFTTLASMVEEQFGLASWQKILDSAQPASGGVYVGTATYSDEEMMSLVASAAEILDIPVTDLIRHYGKYLWGYFEGHYDTFITGHSSLKSFLLSVHSVIHMEVKKLYPESVTPDFEYDDQSANQLVMYYQSPRKLCHLAEGLIEGAAAYYQCSYQLSHDVCMHEGAESCKFEITFNE